jgi:16S rRNA (adenine1518-N6/adenine1519-N6)-dimethyltransferase
MNEKHRPGVSRDQHFMEDGKILERMVSLAGLKPADSVLEIGPGTGNLTKRMLRKGPKVTAVESDRRFRPFLERELNGKVRLVFGNALKSIENLKFNKLISNLPYSICEPLVNRLAGKEFDLAVFSVPEGFARILLARPGEREYSKLSLRSQSFFRTEIRFRIPRTAFSPQPRTESVAIVMKPLSARDYEKRPEKYVMKEVFLQPKKKLRNALMEALINLNKRILGREFTKNMAREFIKGTKIGERVLEKKVSEMSLKDFERVREKVISFP